MSVMMDIIFATFLGAVICLITINANFVIRETAASYNSQIVVQQMLVSDAQIIEGEFRNMGCDVDTNEVRIIQALDTSITFRMAMRPDPGTPIATIKYYSGSSSEADVAGTDNPADRFLYRQQNGGTPERVGVITKFFLRYINFQNDTLPTPVVDRSSIGLVEVSLEVQSPNASFIDSDGNKRFASALWKQTRLASQNLKR
jgi:hypothetical protein